MAFTIISGPKNDTEREYNRLARELNRRKIVEPGPYQYVDACYWSKTGWAVWNKDGGCTCQPARKPSGSGEMGTHRSAKSA